MIKFSIITNRLSGKSSLVVASMLTMAFVPLLARPAVAQQFYQQTNLVTDNQDALKDEGFAPATFTDPNLVNPWGVSFAPGGPFWISDNGTGVSTLYDGAGTPQSLVVAVPGGNPTGQVFNGGNNFPISSGSVSGSAKFLFATEAGLISGWNPSVPPPPPSTNAFLGVDNSASGAIYKGLAIDSPTAGNLLYAANFSGTGKIDVFDGNFAPATLAGSFVDPNLPSGYVPFNIQNIGGKLFVSYALKSDPNDTDETAGAGLGIVNVFDTQGNFLRRLIENGGSLNAPWGLTQAPSNFGEFSNDLLVGNFGDGLINAFDPTTGAFLGQLSDANGKPIQIDGLWALTFGNGGSAGKTNELFFTAGIKDEEHGLFGKLIAASKAERVPEPATISLFSASLIPTLMFLTLEKKRRQG